MDRDNPGMMRKAFEAHDTGVIGVVALDAGVVAGTQPPATDVIEEGTAPSHRAAIGVAGVVTCNVDAA